MGGMGRIGMQWVRQTMRERDRETERQGERIEIREGIWGGWRSLPWRSQWWWWDEWMGGVGEWWYKKPAASPLVFFFFFFRSLSPLVCLSLSVCVADGISQEANQPWMMVAVYNGIALNISIMIIIELKFMVGVVLPVGRLLSVLLP